MTANIRHPQQALEQSRNRFSGLFGGAPQRWTHSKKWSASANAPFYDIGEKALRRYARRKLWRWPNQPIFFFSDLHADREAFRRSLLASGGVQLGADGQSLCLNALGRQALFIVGGDCFDKGPSNLKLLREMGSLIHSGAQVELLAGNHDLRTWIGMGAVHDREVDSAYSHLFVRMGRKVIPLLTELLNDSQARTSELYKGLPSEADARHKLMPQADWPQRYRERTAQLLNSCAIEKEIIRIGEKTAQLDGLMAAAGLSWRDAWAAARQFRRMFMRPNGEFAWFFRKLNLVAAHGSFLFVHAGVCDDSAETLRAIGVDGLNQEFKRLLLRDPFRLYHGEYGNMFRTKYRSSDRHFGQKGLRSLFDAGIYAIVHGHRSGAEGQRLSLRNGMLNLECDTTVDQNTRRIEGLHPLGGSVTVFSPKGRILGRSTDAQYQKELNLLEYCDLVTLS